MNRSDEHRFERLAAAVDIGTRHYTAGAVEVREGTEGQPPMIIGYAAVYDEWTTLYEGEDFWGGGRLLIREVIRPGAFDAALAERQDVRALVNHRPSALLGRTRSNTLRLRSDAHGLAYEIDTAPTTEGRDVVVSIGRGDLTGSSFGFQVRAEGDRRTTIETDELFQVDRELLAVDLFDVSPVTYPAYQGTSSGLRAMDRGSAVFLHAVAKDLEILRQRKRREIGDRGRRLRLVALNLERGLHETA